MCVSACVGIKVDGRGGSCATEVALSVTNNGPHVSCNCQSCLHKRRELKALTPVFQVLFQSESSFLFFVCRKVDIFYLFTLNLEAIKCN